MATISSNDLTLIDWARRKDPDGKIPKIVEMMNKTNEVLDDMVYMEAIFRRDTRRRCARGSRMWRGAR